MTDAHPSIGEVLQNPDVVVISAIIPSTQAIGFVLKNGELPYLIHEEGLYEQTFANIGKQVVGKVLSIDRSLWFLPNWMIGFSKPIDHTAARLGEGTIWCGTESTPALANYAKNAFRWWKRNG